MSKLSFQNKFNQWENWDDVDFVDDGEVGDFIHFKITTAKKQIKVRMHKDEWNLFLHAMPKYKPRIKK